VDASNNCVDECGNAYTFFTKELVNGVVINRCADSCAYYADSRAGFAVNGLALCTTECSDESNYYTYNNGSITECVDTCSETEYEYVVGTECK
jgi:hypothetical protein